MSVLSDFAKACYDAGCVPFELAVRGDAWLADAWAAASSVTDLYIIGHLAGRDSQHLIAAQKAAWVTPEYRHFEPTTDPSPEVYAARLEAVRRAAGPAPTIAEINAALTHVEEEL